MTILSAGLERISWSATAETTALPARRVRLLIGLMPRVQHVTVAGVEGPWVDSNFESGLIERCRRGWNTPVGKLTNELLATYLRQRIALKLVVPEARKRIAAQYVD